MFEEVMGIILSTREGNIQPRNMNENNMKALMMQYSTSDVNDCLNLGFIPKTSKLRYLMSLWCLQCAR